MLSHYSPTVNVYVHCGLYQLSAVVSVLWYQHTVYLSLFNLHLFIVVRLFFIIILIFIFIVDFVVISCSVNIPVSINFSAILSENRIKSRTLNINQLSTQFCLAHTLLYFSPIETVVSWVKCVILKRLLSFCRSFYHIIFCDWFEFRKKNCFIFWSVYVFFTKSVNRWVKKLCEPLILQAGLGINAETGFKN